MYRKHRRLYLVSSLLVLLIFAFTALPAHSTDRANQTVYFNTKTHKVHKMSCTWAKRCTRNCIKLKRKEAYKRGGVPCLS